MIRNLKALVLALMAICAFGAVAASAASAVNGQITSDGPVTLTATETVPHVAGQNALIAFGTTVECPGSEYTGHKYNVTPHTFIPEKATTATLTPHYLETVGGAPNCTASAIKGTATIKMNGCDYVIHGGLKVAAGEYNVTFDVVCEANKQIEVTIFHEGDTKHVGNPPYCKVDIPAQANLEGAKAVNTSGGHIGIVGTIKGIKATRTASTPATILCPTNKTIENAEFAIDVTVSGKNEEGKSTAISVSDD